jgi:hypothetical protein
MPSRVKKSPSTLRGFSLAAIGDLLEVEDVLVVLPLGYVAGVLWHFCDVTSDFVTL